MGSQHGDAYVTRSAEDATDNIFGVATSAVSEVSKAELEWQYRSAVSAWGSKRLHEGGMLEIRSIVLRHLKSLEAQPGFEWFSVSPRTYNYCVMVEAFWSTQPIPVCVWRSGEKFFACGDATF